MNLPFTAQQFLAVFTSYNGWIWPAQLVAYGLGGLAVALAFKRSRLGDVAASMVLATFWAWTGIAYHLTSFSTINPAAKPFGAAFVLEGALLAAAGLRGRLRFRFAGDTRSWVGASMVAYSMVVYPLIGFALGHGFPNGPAFGVTPCPVTIFTFGMLLLADERVPRYLAVLPMLWSFVGTGAAASFGIYEDLGLLVSGLVGTGLASVRRSFRRGALAAPTEAAEGAVS